MTIDKIIVGIVSGFGIVFVYWFFLKRSVETVIVSNSVDITVDGGYTPEIISIQLGKPTNLNFMRKDPSSCLEEVILPDFKIRRFLALNKTTTITITPQKKGEFTYVCGMNMFHGKIIVT